MENVFSFTITATSGMTEAGAEPATLPEEYRLYWRGDEPSCAEAEINIRAAGYLPLLVERIK